jgi:hypothetical protein
MARNFFINFSSSDAWARDELITSNNEWTRREMTVA